MIKIPTETLTGITRCCITSLVCMTETKVATLYLAETEIVVKLVAEAVKLGM